MVCSVEERIRTAWEAGDHDEATSIALTSYGPEILGFLVARMRDETAGSDVFSIFSEDLWVGMPNFGWRCSARAWAFTVARHAANRYALKPERRRRNNLPLSQADIVSRLVAKVRTTTVPHLRSSVKNRMRELRERLPLEDQTILILRVDKDLSWADIVEVMREEGATPDEVADKRELARLRKRFQIVKDRLRKMAQEEGLIRSADQ